MSKALPGDVCLFCKLSNFQHLKTCAARPNTIMTIEVKQDAVVIDLKSGMYLAGFEYTNTSESTGTPQWTDDVNKAHSFVYAKRARQQLEFVFQKNPEMIGYRGRTLAVIEVYRIPVD